MADPLNFIPEGTAAVAVVHEQLRTIGASLQKIEKAVDNHGEQLSKLAVIEERNLAVNAALARAFGEIENTNTRLAAVVADKQALADSLRNDLAAHKAKTDKWVYSVTGFVFAVSVMWGMFGYFFTDTAKSVIEITQAYKYGRMPIISPTPERRAPADPNDEDKNK